MLRYIIISVFLFFNISCISSQEVLIKSNGDTLNITIVEISDNFLIFKKSDSEETIFTIHKDKLDRIIYSNGSVFQFDQKSKISNAVYQHIAERIGILYVENGLFAPTISSKDEVLSSKGVILLYKDIGDEKAAKLFKKGRSQNIIGNLLGLPAGFFLGKELYKTFSSKHNASAPIFIASGIAVIVSMALNVRGVNKIKDSVKSYNNYIFQLVGSENGIGMQMNF